MNTVVTEQHTAAATSARLADPQTWHQTVQLLYREARMLDEERLEEWLSELVHPDIHYQVFCKQLRMRRERRYTGADRVYAWNERMEDLQMKLRALRSGMQWSADPQERLRHNISNVEVYLEDNEKLRVHCNVLTVRNRRVYEEQMFSYGRKDIWQRGPDGALRLLHRLCDVDQRYLTGKNLGFFL